MSFFGKDKVVLALGGGGSRGLAHLGVLQVLEEEGIPIHGILGTSVGALVGASYALRPNARLLIRETLKYLRSERFMNDHFRRMMFGANEAEQNFVQSILESIRKSINFTNLIRKPSILDGSKLQQVVSEFVEDKKFEDTQIPFAVPAIDLRPPMEVLLTAGSLRPAVLASCSLPGFFPPVEMGEMLLADIGVIGSVPVRAAREFIPGALVIAVDLSNDLKEIETVDRGWECILRCEAIAARKLREIELQSADVALRPDLGYKYWSGFSELENLVEAGMNIARAHIDEIRNRLRGVLRFLRVKA
ncbi:MAG: patatin-like phospholipase family protein [Planctomycetota bacterium]